MVGRKTRPASVRISTAITSQASSFDIPDSRSWLNRLTRGSRVCKTEYNRIQALAFRYVDQ